MILNPLSISDIPRIRGGYIDTSNPTIRSVSDRLWGESGGEILDYARLCYEYVAANFKYLYTDTG